MSIKNSWVPLLVVVAAVALLASLRPGKPTVAVGPNVNGISLGEPRDVVRDLLGPPGCQGPLRAGNVASYAEWGSSKLTWNGHPTVTFRPDGSVFAIIGTEYRYHGRTLFQLGSSRESVVAALGPAHHDEADSLTYDEGGGHLTLLFHSGTLYRILWSQA